MSLTLTTTNENDYSSLESLLCELVVQVKGKSFVISYTYFSFKQLMENPLAKEF